MTDLAPTVLQMEGKPVPPTMTGRPLRVSDEAISASSLAAEDRLARFYEHIRPAFIWTFALVQAAVYLYALAISRRGQRQRSI